VTSGRGNHRDLPVDQFGRQRWQSIHLTLGPAVFDGHGLALDIAVLLQPLPESAQQLCVPVRRLGVEEPDHRHRWLLRACALRLSREQQTAASDQSNELPPFYVEHGGLPPLCLLAPRPARSVGLPHGQPTSEPSLGRWGRPELF
jgi:hypothetical protein